MFDLPHLFSRAPACRDGNRFWFLSLLLLVGASPLPLLGQEATPARILTDLSYRQDAKTDYEQQRCKLDLYLPAEGKGFPTLVWFHGGGLQGGDKGGEFAPQLGRRFAAEGIAVASVNYRLSPQVSFPAYIEDAAAAVAFVHNQIEKYGGEPKHLFVSGHSAGGYLTAMIGCDERYLARHEMKLSDLAGILPVSGQMITHFTVRAERKIPRTQPIIDEAAPVFHVGKHVPDCIVFVGSRDMPTRAEENRYFVAALKAAGKEEVTYREVEGRDHGSVANRLGQPDDVVAKTMLEFIRERTKPKAP